MVWTEINTSLLQEANLNADRIRLHQARIQMALSEKVKTTIPVLGACTTNNGGIVSWKAMTRFIGSDFFSNARKFQSSAFEYWKHNHLLSCIPAAGAASRYLGQLQKFVMEIESHFPQIQSFSEYFLSGQYSKIPQIQEQSELQGWLANKKLPQEFLEMGDKLRSQKNPKIKGMHQNFFEGLNIFISGGVLPKKITEKKLDVSILRREHENKEISIRTHWHPEKNSVRPQQSNGTFSATAAALPDLEVEDAFPEIDANHWTERLAESEKINAKNSRKVKQPHVMALGTNERDVLDSYSAAKILLELFSSKPKAFVPTTSEGDSFLKLKLAEQVSLFPCLANFMISPAGQKQAFEEIIAEYGRSLQTDYANIFDLKNTPFAPTWMISEGKSSGQWHVVEQGRDLSTIRFDTSGAPYLTEEEKYSAVAAGHGELIHLFKSMSDLYPNAECLHIRNIDNIIGSSADRAHELNVPAETFRLLRDALEYLRASLDNFFTSQNATSPKADKIISTEFYDALRFVGNLYGSAFAQDALGDCLLPDGTFAGVTEQAAQKILSNIFHWPIYDKGAGHREPWVETRDLLNRPLSVFGVVRKETGDLGGGPVFARLPDGATVKLCMEMPHANGEDSREYFGIKGKATHFNPVLVFFELRTHQMLLSGQRGLGREVNFEHLFDDRFWLLARKEIQGKSVCYHETVLYELIGNSATTNVIFVEVPRTLFNPHKTIFESLGQDRRSYGFEETLQSS